MESMFLRAAEPEYVVCIVQIKLSIVMHCKASVSCALYLSEKWYGSQFSQNHTGSEETTNGAREWDLILL